MRSFANLFIARWRLVLYALFSSVLAVSLGWFSQGLGIRVFDIIAGNQEKQLRTYLAEEESHIVRDLDKASQNNELRLALQSRDIESINALLEAERKTSNMTALTATDENGIALSRTQRSANLGDNVFLSVPVGRAVAHGVSTVVYGPARNFPLGLAAGKFVQNAKGDTVGAVFGGHWLNNEYAIYFKHRYLQDFRNREIVFYSREEGVTGTSIEDPETRKKIISYVNHASSLIQHGRSGDLLNINGTDYVITNHIFSGASEVYGGVLLLTPLPGLLLFRSMLVAFLVAYLFFISLLLIEKISLPKAFRLSLRPKYAFLFILAGIVFALTWSGLYSHGKRSTMYLSKPEITIYNSVMKLRPSSGVYTLNHQQEIAIVVYSGGEPINAVEARLRFDPKIMRVDSIVFNRSICGRETILRNRIDNTHGLVVVTCAIVGDAFEEVRGIVADIRFTPIAEGNTTIFFDEGSRVLASDGLATDVLRSVTSGFYRMFDKGSFSNEITKNTLVIPYSTTHENSSKWYSDKRVHMAWAYNEGTEYVYELAEHEEEVLSEKAKVTHDNEVSLQAPRDGVFYFKIAPRKNGVEGLVSVYKIKIDSTPPEKPTVKISSTTIKKDDIVRLELSSHDELSGLQKNFYIQFNGSVWFPTFSKLYMPFHTKGKYDVSVRVFDNAENYSDTTLEIKVVN